MIPPHPLHQFGRRFLGAGAGAGAGSGGLLSGLSTFFLGAMAAGIVVSLIKQGQPRIAGAVRKGGTAEGKGLEELIAEKERLEDLIAEVAAREGKG
ncbi:MAG: hypothetical protein IT393_04875 [Nitrospirae bacterium]|nr:hypothetical protein [Nitrospirota bacterium]